MRLFTLIISFISAFSAGCQPVNHDRSVDIFYKVFGEGSPILIINGGPGMNSEGFASIADSISKLGFQTIIYDQRGTGRSVMKNIGASTITMELMADDMEWIRKRMKIDKWILFGHSFGGIMATYYAHKYPHHVEKIIFSSSGGVDLSFRNNFAQRISKNLTKIEKDSLDYFQQKINSGDSSSQTRYDRARFLANAYVFDKKNSELIARRLIRINWDINNLVFEDLEKINYDFDQKFNNFHQPVLILQGLNDVISMETAQKINKTFHHSKLVLLEHCGHYGWLDSREKYMNSIKDFLSDGK